MAIRIIGHCMALALISMAHGQSVLQRLTSTVPAGQTGAHSNPAASMDANVPQRSANIIFAPGQKELHLDLNPDQTATATVRLQYLQETAAGDTGNQQPESNVRTDSAATKPDTRNGVRNDAGAANRNSASGTERNGGTATNLREKEKDGKNTSDAALSIKLYLDLNEGKFPACTGSVTVLTGNPSLRPGETSEFPIHIASCSPAGGRGLLGIAGSNGTRRNMPVNLEQRKSPWLARAISVSFATAALLALICGVIVFLHGHKPNDLMGKLSWDFSSSWASNATAFGAAFIFVLQFTGFPDKPKLATRTEYLFVTAFAAALVAFAPAVYRFISPGKVEPSSGGPVLTPQGFVGGFLVACVFTIWGALLQTGLELLIVREFIGTVTLYAPIGTFAGICIGITGVALLMYCWTTILSSIAANASRTGAAKAHFALFVTSAASPAEATERRLAAL